VRRGRHELDANGIGAKRHAPGDGARCVTLVRERGSTSGSVRFKPVPLTSTGAICRTSSTEGALLRNPALTSIAWCGPENAFGSLNHAQRYGSFGLSRSANGPSLVPLP
jgi:hypothetical protein